MNNDEKQDYSIIASQTSAMPSWDRRLQKIEARNWRFVRDFWLSNPPRAITAGQPPETRLEELVELQTIVAEVRGFDVEPKNAPPGLREGVLREGVFLLHKAANALGGAQSNVEHGFLSWSCSSAYQSAFFSMKSILHFLGIMWIQSGRNTYLVDVWPPFKKGDVAPKDRPINVIMVQRIEHRQLWMTFQRVLRNTRGTEDVWPLEFVKSMTDIEELAFARQRNHIHYRNNVWPIAEDLHNIVVRKDFGVRSGGLLSKGVLDEEAEDFSVILAIMIGHMASQMLKDLGSVGGWAGREWNLLDNWFKQPCHSIYQKGIS